MDQAPDMDAFYSTLATETCVATSALAKECQRALDLRLSRHNPKISGLQYSILCALGAGRKTIAELSRHLMRNPSTFVPAVDALERKGLVDRGRDPDDRRRTPLLLTADGRRLLAEVSFVDVGDPLVQALRALGGERSGHLISLLYDLLGHLPDGQELLGSVEEEVRMRVQCPRKERAETTSV
jgi:DNA-binding MarR family transcriptional regulator